MSLDWDLGRIQNYKEVCFEREGAERRMAPLTEALIFACLSIDMQGITATNYKDFWMRIWVIEHIKGPLLKRHEDGKIIDIYTSLADVKKHIGLSTNCSTITWKQFLKRMGGYLEREAASALRRETHKLEGGVE